jgi:hypothetical protein
MRAIASAVADAHALPQAIASAVAGLIGAACAVSLVERDGEAPEPVATAGSPADRAALEARETGVLCEANDTFLAHDR